jgi:short-subunit dehydrogenase
VTASVEELQAAININITSVHAAFYAALPAWLSAGKGNFLLTGGGLSANGAYSVGLGLQFGSPTKSYFKNFAQAYNATYGKDGVHVCCITVSGLVYGGDIITGGDKDSEAQAAFRKLLADTYVAQATNKDAFVDEIAVAPPA